jgi:molecular chaperone GrpE (heat shock protein)
MTVDPELRKRFLADAERWLESLEEGSPQAVESEPNGASSVPSLFDLFSQMAALTQEVKLANRTTNRLHTEITFAMTKLTETTANPSPAALSKARREGRLEMVLEILDIRDRFVRGIAEAERQLGRRSAFIDRLFGRNAALEALVSGNRLALERLDDTLRRFDVVEIPSIAGEPFDPELMKCVEVVRTDTPPQRILEVIRPGFTHQGRVLRFAEVRVSAPGSEP